MAAHFHTYKQDTVCVIFSYLDNGIIFSQLLFFTTTFMSLIDLFFLQLFDP